MSSSAGSTGRFTLDATLVVRTWDGWMVAATHIPEAAACGQSIVALYPELAERGLLARLRHVANSESVEVLAPALHKYFLPCAPRNAASRFDRMRQRVVIAPIRDIPGASGVSVTIEDVTERFEAERQKAVDFDSHTEAVRFRIVNELAGERSESALLSSALSDDSWRVRRAAAEGLAEHADRDVITTLLQALREHHRNPALLNAALTALARTRQDIALDVIALLDTGDVDVRTYAALALGLIGDVRATASLVAVMDTDADANVQFHAIEALGRIADRSAADAVAQVATRRDFFLSFPALDALAAIGDAFVAPSLVPLLDDALLAPAVIACLGAIGADDVVVPLVQQIDRAGSPIGTLARAIADIASRFETRRRRGALDATSTLIATLTRGAITDDGVDALLGAIDDADDDEARGIVCVASWLPHDGVDGALAKALEREPIRRLVADLLSRRGVAAAPFVEAMTASGDDDVRRAAAFALGGIGSVSSVPALLAMLEDDADSGLVIEVVTALGAIGDSKPFDALFALLDHPDATVRQAAIGALNSIAHPDAETRINETFADPSPRRREGAVRIAGYFTYESSLGSVIACCRDEEPLVRRAAIEALATFDSPLAWQAMGEAAVGDADPTVRAAAARSIGHSRWPDGQAALSAALRDTNLWVRYYAARASANIEHTNSDLLSGLVSCIRDDRATPVRVAAIDAVRSLAKPELFEPLFRAAQDVDDDVSAAALRALGSLPYSMSSHTLDGALSSPAEARRHAALDALAQLESAARGSVSQLVRLASDPRDVEMGNHAIEALGKIGGTEAVIALIALGGRPSLRDAAIRALSSDSVSRIDELAAASESASDAEKALIIASLAEMDDERAGKAIAAMLVDPSAAVQRTASRTLAQIDRLRTK